MITKNFTLKFRRLGILFGACMISGAPILAVEEPSGSVKLAWDLSWEPGIGGYRIHYGTESGSYTATIDVGYQVRAELTNLPVGETFYSAVTAYSATGLESDYSDEITFTVPAPPEARDSDGDLLSDLYESTYAEGGDLDPWSDPDADGLLTIVEFVHGMDPTRRESRPLATLETVYLDETAYLGIRYLIDPLAGNFVSSRLQRSIHLEGTGSWDPDHTTVVSSVTSPDHPGLLEILERSLSPMDSQPQEFLRFSYAPAEAGSP